MVKITITGSDPVTGGLVFDNDLLKGDREADHKDTVKWHLGDGCGVKDIISIFMKPPTPTDPSVDIWDIQPHKAFLSKNWRGKVDDKSPRGSKWHYGIRWRDMTGHTAPDFDPKIIVNSTVGP